VALVAPIVLMILPQFGSLPNIAALTKLEPTIAFAICSAPQILDLKI